MKPLSILLLGTQMATGGAQKVLLDQARWFHEHGHNVIAVFFYDKEGFYEKWQNISPFRIKNLNVYQKKRNILANLLFFFKGLWDFYCLLRSEKIEVIETFTHDSNLLGLPLAWLAGVPSRIATHHGVIDNFPRWREKIHSWFINHGIANMLVAVSERTQQQAILEGVHADRVVVIKNGIAPVSFEGRSRLEVRKDAGIKDNEIFLISVGRLVYQKAHETLVRAMPLVLEKRSNVKLGICGDGVLYEELKLQITELGLFDSVKLLGKWDSVAEFLKMADIFVLPSRWEGLPIALLEAMNAGLPVIATKVEGVDEVVIEGEHGLLVAPEDADGLANAILQLIADPQLRLKMGAAAKAHILKDYTENKMCEQYLHLMIKFLPNGKG